MMGKAKSRKFVLAASAALFVAALCAVIFHDREPSYEGKSLSDWIVITREQPHDEHAREVMRQLASNNIPVLLEWLRRDDRPTWRERFFESKRKVIGWLEAHKLKEPTPYGSPMDWKGSYRSLAKLTLENLGPSAREAIPTLIKMLGEIKTDPLEVTEAAGSAFVILPHLAPDSIHPLIEALGTTNYHYAWFLAAGALGNIGPSANSAIPALRTYLTNKEAEVRFAAAETIGKLGGDPGEFVPVMIQVIQNDNWDRLDYDLQVLLNYKSYAKPAVPFLTNLLAKIPNSSGGTNQMYRWEITNALNEIAPDVAAKISSQSK